MFNPIPPVYKCVQGKMFNPDENIPAVDEETLKMFGKLCIKALEQEHTRILL